MRLIFRSRFGDKDGYFALDYRADYVDRIDDAISRAKTWDEFSRLLPPGDFGALGLWNANGGDHAYQDGQQFKFVDDYHLQALLAGRARESIIDARDPFDAGRVPGVDSGDYPPILELEQDSFLPRGFSKHGSRITSYMNESWWQFPVDKFEEMKAELESHGMVVVRETRSDPLNSC